MTDGRSGDATGDDGGGAEAEDARGVVREGYDALAADYESNRIAGEVEATTLATLRGRLPPDARVLDAGCGGGEPALAAVEGASEAVGLDFSTAQLALARTAAPRAALVQGDMTGLPFADGSFDAVTAFHSLIHVPLQQHERVLAEFARVLAPGGWLLVTEGSEEWCGSHPDWLDSGVEMRWEIAGAERTSEQLAAAGFTVVDSWSSPDELADDEEATKPLFLAELH